MTRFNVFDKDPNAVLDYTWDWNDATVGPYLDTGETIVTSVVTVPTGITLSSQSNTTTTSTAWLTGGTAGTSYTVVCRITTTGGRTDDRSIIINVKEM